MIQILIQPRTLGNIGQYTANAITCSAKDFDITDTSITVQCNLINIISASNITAIPDPWGSFQVTVAFPLSMTRTTLQTNIISAVLAAGNPVFIQR